MSDRLPSFALLAALPLLTVACGGSGGQSEKPAPPATTVAPAAEAAAEGETPAAAAGDFGVAECDSFFTKYFACIDANVPEAGRDAVRQAAEMTKASLQQAASAPDAGEAVAAACTQAEEAAKQAMAAYNCEW